MQVDNAKYLDVAMSMSNLVEYCINYVKTLESIWNDHKNDPNDNITDSLLSKFKSRITGRTAVDFNIKNVEIAVQLYYLRDLWGTLQIPLINSEIDFTLPWSAICVITNSTGAGTFEVSITKLYVLVVTLSTKDNSNLL